MKILPIILFVFGVVIVFIIINEFAKRNAPRTFKVKKINGGGEAMTFPPFGIFAKGSAINDPIIMQHEICHWRQYQKKGLVDFWWDYLNQSSKYSYEDTPMEEACFLLEK